MDSSVGRALCMDGEPYGWIAQWVEHFVWRTIWMDSSVGRALCMENHMDG